MSEQLELVFYTNLPHPLSLVYFFIKKCIALGKQTKHFSSDQHLQPEQVCRVVCCSSLPSSSCRRRFTFVSSCCGSTDSRLFRSSMTFMFNTHIVICKGFCCSCNDLSVSCLTHSQMWIVSLVLFFSKLSILDIWGCCHNFSDIMIVSSYFTHSVYSSCRTKWHGEVCGLFWKLSFYTHLHIYKKFNPTRIQQKQSELHKREFLTQTHPQQKQCTTLSHYAKS